MNFETILYEKKERVLTITLNRPEVLDVEVAAGEEEGSWAEASKLLDVML